MSLPSRKPKAAADFKAFQDERARRMLTHAVSWSPDGTIEWAPPRNFVIPPEGGIYMVHDLRGVLYVGKACNLRRRFLQHDEAKKNPRLKEALRRPLGLLMFSWRLVETPGERSAIERQMIATLQPVCNHLLVNTPL